MFPFEEVRQPPLAVEPDGKQRFIVIWGRWATGEGYQNVLNFN